MGYFLGVDLGTTFSAAATAHDGRTEVVTLGDRSPAIPSVVVLRAHGEVLVGDAAERRALSEPARTAREFKRRLGDPTPMILGGTPYGAEALMALLLRHVVEAVAEREGSPPEAIVLSHPANYGPYKKDLLVEMVRQADVGTVRFVTEPEAAALHYAERDRVGAGEVVAVYDFGGGTFDAAVLRATDDGFEIIGTPEGMDRLGGIDFDQAVFAHVRKALGGLVDALDPKDETAMSALARLRDDCRIAKEALSSDTDATIPVMLPNAQTEVRLTRDEFEAMIRPRLVETIDSLKRAIRSAAITTEDITRVLLVGGSSRIPLVGQMVREATGRPISMDADPKYAIALGAAVAGERRAATAEPETPATVTDEIESAPPEPVAPAPAPVVPAVAAPTAAKPPKAPKPPKRPKAPKPPRAPGGGNRRVLVIAAAAVAAVGIVAVVALGGGGGGGGGGEEGSKARTDLAVGDCWNDDAGQQVETVACDTAHDAEVFAVVEYPDAPDEFPGVNDVESIALDECPTRLEDVIGSSSDSELEATFVAPGEAAWNDGEREITCSAVSASGEKLGKPIS